MGGEKGGCLRERNTLFDIQNGWWCVAGIMMVVIPVFPHAVQLYLLSREEGKCVLAWSCHMIPVPSRIVWKS